MDIVAQDQIDLNKKYGKRLVAIAWSIEIVAASIGLFIGFNQAQQSIDYYATLSQTATLVGDQMSNVIIGAAPFLIIAAVELTKIPLVLGFYRTRDFFWRLLFLVTLLCLIFVTFETMFNGLERSLNVSEDTVGKPKRLLVVQQNKLKEINLNLAEINSRTTEVIDREYAEKINSEFDDRKVQLDQARVQKDADLQVIKNQLNSITEQTANIASVSGLGDKVTRIREDIARTKDAYSSKSGEIVNQHQKYIVNINEQISQLDSDESNEIANKGFFASTQAIQDRFADKRNRLIDDRSQAIARHDKEMVKLTADYESSLMSDQSKLDNAESSLTSSEANSSGLLSDSFSQLNTQLLVVNEAYEKNKSDIIRTSEDRLANIAQQKENQWNIQKQRESRIPDLEAQRLIVRETMIDLDEEINEAARGNNVYRITQKIFNHDNASDVTKEELKWVGYTWFGSIALIAASVGSVLALAGFILQDPESYRKKPKPLLSWFRDFFAALILNLKNRRVGVLRNAFRAMMISIRRFMRAPRIRYVEIKVQEVVEKEKLVPGPERIVIKEVPKEIIRKEMVYVPFHSVEDGALAKGEKKDE